MAGFVRDNLRTNRGLEMKKGKQLNGRNAEECKAIDWADISEHLDKNGAPMPKSAKKKKKPKKDEYAWDIDDVDEDWTIDFDDDGNLIDNTKSASAKKKESRKPARQSAKSVDKKPEKQDKKAGDELEDSIVATTMKEIEEEEILKVDATDSGSKAKKKSASLSEADEEAIRKSVDDKIIIRSEELKTKRNSKNKSKKSAKEKSDFDKEEERLDRLKEKESIIMASSRRKVNKYTDAGKIVSDSENASEFRKKSLNWRYDGVDIAQTSDAEIEKAIENGDFSGRAYKFTFTQAIALVMSIVITAAGVMTTGVYANYRSEVNKAAAYAALPQFEEDISEEMASDDEEFYDVDPGLRFEEDIVELEEVASSMSLSLVLTSVEKDLKIKLVNGEDILVKNVPWGVVVTDNKGDEKHYQDEDTDGVIHLTDVSAGDYSVSIEPSEALSAYTFPRMGQEVSVKDKVEYKVIANIKDEIKKESEVDVALEDPNGGMGADHETESVPMDTVEWVESTQTEQGELYVESEVDLSKTEMIIGVADRLIAALGSMTNMGSVSYGHNAVMAMISSPVRQVADIFDIIGEGGDNNDDDDGDNDDDNDDDDDEDIPEKPIGDGDEEPVIEEDPGEVKTVTISRSSMQLNPGETDELRLTYTPANAIPATVDWTSSNPAVAIVDNGVVIALSNGTARITATVNATIVVYCDVTVSEQKVSGVVVSGPSTIAVDETALFSARCSSTDEIVSWESSSTQVISVTGHGNSCNATGIMAGTVKLKAISKSGAFGEITVTVTGGRELEYDDNAQLYDSQKNRLYVYDNGAYRLAKYIDYRRGTFSTFYKKIGEVLYTGWQTIEGLTYYYTANHEKVTGEQIIGGVKYFFDGDGALAQGSGTLGIDVSKYQPSINWDSVKASGIKYVIIRCGYRGASTGSLIQDPYFVSHIKGAKAAGLKVGVYFFSNALNEYEAVEEASMCAELCSGYGLNYPVFIDVESSSRPGYNSLSVEQRTANIKAFCSTISSAGYTPGLYANKNWLTEKINTSSLSCKIWLAQYNSSGPTYTGRYDMWQYTSKGHVDGISGNVDMDQSYLGY